MPEVLKKELGEPPLSNFLSSNLLKPVNFEADPFALPQQTYHKPGNNFHKGGFKKNYIKDQSKNQDNFYRSQNKEKEIGEKDNSEEQ